MPFQTSLPGDLRLLLLTASEGGGGQGGEGGSIAWEASCIWGIIALDATALGGSLLGSTACEATALEATVMKANALEAAAWETTLWEAKALEATAVVKATSSCSCCTGQVAVGVIGATLSCYGNLTSNPGRTHRDGKFPT